MCEIVFCAPDYASIYAEAKRLSFLDSDNTIITNGVFVSGGGWFLNLIGPVYDEKSNARPGYWGRLRLNGIPSTMETFSSDIVQYKYSDSLQGWSKDGVTLAPTWIADIGVIA